MLCRGSAPPDAPFTFARPLESNVRSESVFRLGTNHNNIDVNVAPARWFDDRFGGTLHPTDPDPDGTRAQLIEQNVVDSISAYEDDDLDGNPDPLG